MGIVDRARRAWNTFTANEAQPDPVYPTGMPAYGGQRPDRNRMRYFNDRSIVTAILVRMAVDVSGIELRHIEVDPEKERFVRTIRSGLHKALMIESNIDQGARAFRQDVMLTMLNYGSVAIVPVDALRNSDGEITEVLTLRAGPIVGWAPYHVRVSLYNEERCVHQELWLPKREVAVVENPFFAVMNQSNSVMQRLTRKLNQLDAIDDQSASGKLDLIIQLPYTLKTETKKAEARARRGELEEQLTSSKYGVAYADAAEKIVQLNRPVENNLMKQVEFLTDMLYGQMGVTREIMDGTADEKAMIAYFDRTIEPFIDAIAQALRRTFIGTIDTEDIAYFRNRFKLVPMADLAEIVDKFTRNEILSANEVRGYMGILPSDDEKADMLINSNMPVEKAGVPASTEAGPPAQLQKEGQNGV